MVERLRLATAPGWEKEGLAQGERRPVMGAVDETFVQRRRLVCLDVATGAVVRAEGAAARRFDPWAARANDRLTTCSPAVVSLASARAQALVTLAQTGLGCLSMPDVVPLRQDLATGDALALFGRRRQATPVLEQATPRLETVQQHAQAARRPVEPAQALVADGTTSLHHWQGVHHAWPQHWSNLSRLRPPWRCADATRQPSQAVERQWRAELQARETLREPNGLPMQQATVDQVGTQRAGLSALVDGWWPTGRQDLAQMAMTPRWTTWVEAGVLSRMSWQEQRRRTRGRGHKAPLALGLQRGADACARHPCPRQLHPAFLAGGKAWAGEHATTCQRASSAVAGRNGSLSPMPHTHRGVPRRRSPVWTARHNVDGRAADGTTPASRCFRRSCPALFASVFAQIDALPMPRQRRQAIAVCA
jgi:hypothetical protein